MSDEWMTGDDPPAWGQRSLPWQDYEDEYLLSLYNTYGPKKWQLIAEFLSPHTAVDCKNRFNSSVKKRIEYDFATGKSVLKKEKRKPLPFEQVLPQGDVPSLPPLDGINPDFLNGLLVLGKRERKPTPFSDYDMGKKAQSSLRKVRDSTMRQRNQPPKVTDEFPNNVRPPWPRYFAANLWYRYYKESDSATVDYNGMTYIIHKPIEEVDRDWDIGHKAGVEFASLIKRANLALAERYFYDANGKEKERYSREDVWQALVKIHSTLEYFEPQPSGYNRAHKGESSSEDVGTFLKKYNEDIYDQFLWQYFG